MEGAGSPASRPHRPSYSSSAPPEPECASAGPPRGPRLAIHPRPWFVIRGIRAIRGQDLAVRPMGLNRLTRPRPPLSRTGRRPQPSHRAIRRATHPALRAPRSRGDPVETLLEGPLSSGVPAAPGCVGSEWLPPFRPHSGKSCITLLRLGTSSSLDAPTGRPAFYGPGGTAVVGDRLYLLRASQPTPIKSAPTRSAAPPRAWCESPPR